MIDDKQDKTLTDQVTEILIRQIKQGVYPVNTRLPSEKSMTEKFRVSRTVIRETISRLKSEGLVESRQGSGTVVLEPVPTEAFRLEQNNQDPLKAVLQIIELRRGIEVEMAALAAQNRTEEDLVLIEQALDAIDLAVNKGETGVAEDLAFHMAISYATKNPHYTDLLDLLTSAVKDALIVTRSYDENKIDFKKQVRQEHRNLWLAIKKSDVTAARSAAYLHMCNTALRVTQADDSYWQSEPSNRAVKRLMSTGLHKIITKK